MTASTVTEAATSQHLAGAFGNVTVTPLSGSMGCVVSGLDLREPLADDVSGLIRKAFLAHRILIFRNQSLDEASLVRVTREFGEPVVHHVGEYLDQDFPQIMRLSNNTVDGKPLGAPNNGIHWHSDQIFRPEPMLATLLYGERTPAATGGDTLFSDMYGAYEALSPEMKERLAPLQAVHSFVASYERNYIRARKLSAQEMADNPDVCHPVVRTHPETGRKALFVDPDSVKHIEGMDRDESDDLLRALFAHVEDPRFVYRHKWRQGDLVVWDNRCLMHRATNYDESREIRLMLRTQTQGDRPF